MDRSFLLLFSKKKCCSFVNRKAATSEAASPRASSLRCTSISGSSSAFQYHARTPTKPAWVSSARSAGAVVLRALRTRRSCAECSHMNAGMFTTSLPPPRSTRCSSASAKAGSTSAWHSTSALTAASKLASAKGRALMLPRTTGAPDLAAARGAARAAYSSPTQSRPGRRFSTASRPPVPQPASSTRPDVRLRASSSRACRARYHHIPCSAASINAYSAGSMRPFDTIREGCGNGGKQKETTWPS